MHTRNKLPIMKTPQRPPIIWIILTLTCFQSTKHTSQSIVTCHPTVCDLENLRTHSPIRLPRACKNDQTVYILYVPFCTPLSIENTGRSPGDLELYPLSNCKTCKYRLLKLSPHTDASRHLDALYVMQNLNVSKILLFTSLCYNG